MSEKIGTEIGTVFCVFCGISAMGEARPWSATLGLPPLEGSDAVVARFLATTIPTFGPRWGMTRRIEKSDPYRVQFRRCRLVSQTLLSPSIRITVLAHLAFRVSLVGYPDSGGRALGRGHRAASRCRPGLTWPVYPGDRDLFSVLPLFAYALFGSSRQLITDRMRPRAFSWPHGPWQMVTHWRYASLLGWGRR